MDVDVYGPDVPLMMGAKGKPGMFENKIIPVEAHGIKIMSIGLLVAEREALVWRGPMIHSAVQQFLRDVNWGPLDYLVFDMPPGTGDAQLSLSQVVPLSGVVMVTTPQDVALLDVRKALGMFRKLNVPILGIVENMSYFIAPDTGRRYGIFGEGGGQRVAEEFGVPLLGQIPLEMETREGGDAGVPITVGPPRLGPGRRPSGRSPPPSSRGWTRWPRSSSPASGRRPVGGPDLAPDLPAARTSRSSRTRCCRCTSSRRATGP